MGLRERQHQKLHDRAVEFLQPMLFPGDQRLIVIRLTAVAVDRFKRGRLWMLLYLRRFDDGRAIRFRPQRSGWAVTAQVTEAAEVLRRARAGLPG